MTTYAPPKTREEAIEALQASALEIACETLFERFLAEEPAGRRLVRAINGGAHARYVAECVLDCWVAGNGQFEWFHNNRAGQRITDALQVLVGVRSRNELYTRARLWQKEA